MLRMRDTGCRILDVWVWGGEGVGEKTPNKEQGTPNDVVLGIIKDVMASSGSYGTWPSVSTCRPKPAGKIQNAIRFVDEKANGLIVLFC
jgi:hypothetical protein